MLRSVDGALTRAANRGIPLKEACSNPCTSRGAGGELLQQRRTKERAGGSIDRL